jgi:hypothetical protein
MSGYSPNGVAWHLVGVGAACGSSCVGALSGAVRQRMSLVPMPRKGGTLVQPYPDSRHVRVDPVRPKSFRFPSFLHASSPQLLRIGLPLERDCLLLSWWCRDSWENTERTADLGCSDYRWLIHRDMPQMRARSTSLSAADCARFFRRLVCHLNGVNLTTAFRSATALLRPRVIPLESTLGPVSTWPSYPQTDDILRRHHDYMVTPG